MEAPQEPPARPCTCTCLGQACLSGGTERRGPAVICPHGGAGAIGTSTSCGQTRRRRQRGMPTRPPQAVLGADESGKVLDTCGPGLDLDRPSSCLFLRSREPQAHSTARQVAPDASGPGEGRMPFCRPHPFRAPPAATPGASVAAVARPQRHYFRGEQSCQSIENSGCDEAVLSTGPRTAILGLF